MCRKQNQSSSTLLSSSQTYRLRNYVERMNEWSFLMSSDSEHLHGSQNKSSWGTLTHTTDYECQWISIWSVVCVFLYFALFLYFYTENLRLFLILRKLITFTVWIIDPIVACKIKLHKWLVHYSYILILQWVFIRRYADLLL